MPPPQVTSTRDTTFRRVCMVFRISMDHFTRLHGRLHCHFQRLVRKRNLHSLSTEWRKTGRWELPNALIQRYLIRAGTLHRTVSLNQRLNKAPQSILVLKGGMNCTDMISVQITSGRLCPGRLLAENTLWAAAAVMLATLRFENAKVAAGNRIDFEPTFRHGNVRWDLQH